MQRFFVNRINSEFILTTEQLHQIKDVLRMNVNDELEFIFNKISYLVKIENMHPFKVKIIEQKKLDNELNVDITLLYCLAKKEKIEFAIQKATELGAKRIVLVDSSRCVFKIKKIDEIKKIERYKKISLEAAEQCNRVVIPKIIGVIDFIDINKYLSDLNLIAYEKEKNHLIDENLLKNKKSITILIGAEGGFSPEEVEYALNYGYLSVSLGKRILRSETAVVYALSLLSHYVEKEYVNL